MCSSPDRNLCLMVAISIAPNSGPVFFKLLLLLQPYYVCVHVHLRIRTKRFACLSPPKEYPYVHSEPREHVDHSNIPAIAGLYLALFSLMLPNYAQILVFFPSLLKRNIVTIIIVDMATPFFEGSEVTAVANNTTISPQPQFSMIN